jgi:expansin (peptidoglycan-binding protein)
LPARRSWSRRRAKKTTAAAPETRSGEATYYDFADGSGNCGFPATPNDLLVAAMNHTDYAGSAACGACVRVAGPGGSVDVRIVDRCPECPAGDIDLSPEAFEQIAELSAGRVPITWQYIECAIQSPVVFHFKDGSNEWWTAVQLRNHRHAIASFAYRDDGGAWVDVARLDYNYFVEDAGMGPGPYAFRVVDVMGNELVEEDVAAAENAEVPGTSQFPACD